MWCSYRSSDSSRCPSLRCSMPALRSQDGWFSLRCSMPALPSQDGWPSLRCDRPARRSQMSIHRSRQECLGSTLKMSIHRSAAAGLRGAPLSGWSSVIHAVIRSDPLPHACASPLGWASVAPQQHACAPLSGCSRRTGSAVCFGLVA